ncbi:hypothetical protein SAMN05444166_3695 [Singulisphaera sp. GP187]|uniref:hypothetical protein n=1 Tax=Singulisphaera sp. GP187 TaxID=1882752 RepID=UPI000927697C|nr:hypothetical protein [Singulisphaera sp. GP187]SIO31171.1 hypothetical protein SAMN05444166_3695 [Singulisphaera sp. GP187]
MITAKRFPYSWIRSTLATSAVRACQGLLIASTVAAAAGPEDGVPTPSAAAVRLIGGEEVVFGPGAAPVAGVRLDHPLGKSDFKLGLSFQGDASDLRDLGDLASLWDAKRRQGFTLGLRDNTGVTTSHANQRQLQFGIDAGTTPSWRAEGRPGKALLGFSIAVHEGRLYVGTCEPNLPDRGQVYRYDGPGRWEPLGAPDASNSVTAMAVHEGRLYVATGKYLTVGSALPASDNQERGGRVFRFAGPGKWEPAGDLDPTPAVAALVSFGGHLYASSMYKPAGFFRYEGGERWTSIPTPGDRRVQSLAVFDGALYAGSYDGASVARFDGKAWTDLGQVASNVTQTYSFAVYENLLHVGAWPTGKVYRMEPAGGWADAGRLGTETEVMGMLVHNGVFYAGSLPGAKAYRYEGDTSWSLLKQLDATPDVVYRRAWTMATYQGRMFVTTLPSGEVWSMSAGSLATHDHEVAPGWHDVVAQRLSGKLRLYLDGRLVAQTEDNNLDLATEGQELTIGDGPRGRFVGSMKNAWFEVTP